VKLWDIRQQQVLGTLQCEDTANTVAFSPDGTLLAVGDDLRAITLWDVATQRKISTVETEHVSVSSIVFVDNKQFVSAGEDNSICSWDIEALVQEPPPLKPPQRKWFHFFHGNNAHREEERPAFRQSGCCRWRMPNAHIPWKLGDTIQLALSHDGTCIISMNPSSLILRNAESGRAFSCRLGFSQRGIFALACQGNIIIFQSEEGLAISSLDKMQPITIKPLTAVVRAIAIAPNDSFFVVAASDGDITVRSLSQKLPQPPKLLASFSSEWQLLSCTVANDNQTIIAGDVNGHVHFFELEGGGHI
jgi:WD40 repeat protein